MRILLVLFLLLTSCSNYKYGETETGALAGTAIGAGTGAIIGDSFGHTGSGVAIGSAIGAIAGGLYGRQVELAHDEMDLKDEKISNNQAQLEQNQQLINELRNRGLDVRETKRGVVVNLPDILFEFDSAELTSGAYRAIDEIYDVTKRNDRRLSVEGHTDNVGTVIYNKDLSDRRSRSVAKALRETGISKSRIRTFGYGESQPVSTNRTEEGRSKNRRVEVVIEN